MKKIKKIFIASCLLCATMALGGTALAIAETNSSSRQKQNLGYAPDIAIDWGEYSANDVPSAVKGTPYKLFTATAEDVYSEKVDVKTRVYLNYYGDSKNIITVDNNTVTPEYYGVYTVEYTAKDMFGNTGKETYNFECDDVETLSISLSDQKVMTALAGDETEIADYEYANNFGKVNIKVTATHEDGKAVYDLTDKTSFTPMYAGKYTISYDINDYSLSVNESYELTVERRSDPVFLSKAAMPKYFIVGKNYTLPSVEAYQFLTGIPSKIKPVVTVKYGTDKAKQLKGFDFTPDKVGELTITYTILCAGIEKTQVYYATAVDPHITEGDFDIAKYFYAPKSDFTVGNDSITIATATDKESVEFINTLAARAFSITLSNDVATSNFSAINIYLKDNEDEDVYLKITYGAPGLSNAYLCVNDREHYDIRNSESFTQKISYDDSKRTVDFNGKVTLNCPKNFTGFPSGKINFSLEFVDVTGASEIKLYKLNNQTLGEWDGDYFEPEMWFSISDRNSYRINETISLSAVTYADVLDPEVEFFITARTPSGNIVVSNTGVNLLNYEGDPSSCTFRFTEYGEYLISYTAKDGSGNSKTYSYSLAVVDIVPPEAEFVNFMPKVVTANKAFKLPGVVVKDDLSAPEKCEIKVILLGPAQDAVTLNLDEAYKLLTKGDYRLYYMISDEAGNTIIMMQQFRVE